MSRSKVTKTSASGTDHDEKSLIPKGAAEPVHGFRVSLAARLEALLDLYDSRIAASRVAGVTPEQLARYLAAGAKPPFEVVMRLARDKGLSLDWLAGLSSAREIGGGAGDELVLVPVHDVRASSGHGAMVFDESVGDHYAFRRAWVRSVTRSTEDRLAVVFNAGDSNAPDINDGDAMLIDRGIERIVDDAYYVFSREGDLLTKMTERMVDGRVTLKARNPAYEAQILSREEAARLTVFGRVLWRGGRI
jgi:Peptidase S24-like